ncbi:MAG: hypothetical protein OJF49_001479 [Ktedonobacterales bacterium]|jgi:hypothetical protein|nr:MAG: hypothetical protein OJF49_001479 [Ktedonobacterales bacterium]
MEDTATAFFVAIIIALFVIYGVGIAWFAYDLRRPLSNHTFRRYLKKLGLRDTLAQVGNPETRELETLVTAWRRAHHRISIGAGIGGLSFMLCSLSIALTLPVSNVGLLPVAFARTILTIYVCVSTGFIGLSIGRAIATHAVLRAMPPVERREPVEITQPPIMSNPRSLWKRWLWMIPLMGSGIITLVASGTLIIATHTTQSEWGMVVPYVALFWVLFLALIFVCFLERRELRSIVQLTGSLHAYAPHLPTEATSKLMKAIGMLVVGAGSVMVVPSLEFTLIIFVIMIQPAFRLSPEFGLLAFTIIVLLWMVATVCGYLFQSSALPQAQPNAPAANGPAV